jgi:toxin HigB-1
MITSFKGEWAEPIFKRRKIGKGFPPDLIRATRRKLSMVNAAKVLGDLKKPPSNRLEKLEGDRIGQHSIRINDQWRVCFVWTGKDAADVEVTDYH